MTEDEKRFASECVRATDRMQRELESASGLIVRSVLAASAAELARRVGPVPAALELEDLAGRLKRRGQV